MPRPPRKAFEGAKYHITVRGNARQDIFLSDEDRQRFLDQLRSGVEKDGVIVYGYVLTTNHYHLLVETPRSNVNAFMQRLNTAYGMYFRYKHRRPGHVLQGRFKGKLVEGDEYLLRLTRYLHLNPVKVKRIRDLPERERLEYLRGYRWSTYQGYAEPKKEEPWVNYRWRGLIGGRSPAEKRARYRRYVEGFIARDDEDLKAALAKSEHAVGDESFVAEVEGEMRQERKRATVEHDVSWPGEVEIPLEVVDRAVSEVFGCDVKMLGKHGRAVGVAKSVAIEAACRLSGKRQRAVGQHYGGVSGAAVGYQRRRLMSKIHADRTLAGKLEAVERAVRKTVER